MAFYYNGEKKTRPGVYMRTTNRGHNSGTVASMPVTPTPKPDPEPPVETDGLMVIYDGESVVTLKLPRGSTVSYDEAGSVTLSGSVSVAYDAEGNVTIGG